MPSPGSSQSGLGWGGSLGNSKFGLPPRALFLPQDWLRVRNSGDLGCLEQYCWYLPRRREEDLASCLRCELGSLPLPPERAWAGPRWRDCGQASRLRSETPFWGDISPLQRQEFSPSPTVTVSSKVILLSLWGGGARAVRRAAGRASLRRVRGRRARLLFCVWHW